MIFANKYVFVEKQCGFDGCIHQRLAVKVYVIGFINMTEEQQISFLAFNTVLHIFIFPDVRTEFICVKASSTVFQMCHTKERLCPLSAEKM